MARTREIKPAFFRNPTLLELPIHARLLFIGLWTEADREGRLEDRPRYLKRELLTYDDCDVDQLLDLLAATLDEDGQPFISRYEVSGQRLIHITKFTKHQRIHPKEAHSVLPGPAAAAEHRDGDSRNASSECVSAKTAELHGKPRNYTASREKVKPSREKVVVSRAIPSALSEPSALSAQPPCIPPAGEPALAPPKPSRAQAAKQVPVDWQPGEALLQWCTEAVPHVQIQPQLEQFRDYHRAKGSLLKDIDAAFRNWMRNSVKFDRGKGGQGTSPPKLAPTIVPAEQRVSGILQWPDPPKPAPTTGGVLQWP